MNDDVRISIDFSVCDDLVRVFKESTGDEFVGDRGGGKCIEWCREELERICRTRVYGKRERLGILKILYNEVLVGFSLPRLLGKDEYGNFKIDEECVKDWYRLGTIYTLKDYRKMGITSRAIGLFGLKYLNCVWVCDVKNEASKRCAFAGGFDFSHRLWHRVKGETSLTELNECERISLVFKREQYI